VSGRQSARVIELNANPGKVDVEARARKEIKPDPIAPAPPSWMTHPVARSTWKYLAAELEHDALLTKRDRELFAGLCTSAAMMADAARQLQPDRRKGFARLDVDEGHQGRTRRNPLLMVWRGALEDYLKLSARFGLTPRDRIPLELGAPAGPPPADEDEDDSLEG
jgi:P27 family predicted phage terminase small subunit